MLGASKGPPSRVPTQDGTHRRPRGDSSTWSMRSFASGASSTSERSAATYAAGPCSVSQPSSRWSCTTRSGASSAARPSQSRAAKARPKLRTSAARGRRRPRPRRSARRARHRRRRDRRGRTPRRRAAHAVLVDLEHLREFHLARCRPSVASPQVASGTARADRRASRAARLERSAPNSKKRAHSAEHRRRDRARGASTVAGRCCGSALV